MKKVIVMMAALALAAGAHAKMRSMDVQVGGQPMMAMKDIVDNAVNSDEHTTLVAAVKAAGLVETLKGKGPFTVFAPTNDAFENLSAGTVESLLEADNKSKLTHVLTYHVVAGRLDSAALRKLVEKGDGQTMLKTVSGGSLWIRMNGPSNLVVQDGSGRIADISTYDVLQSNGVIHVIDAVVLPS